MWGVKWMSEQVLTETSGVVAAEQEQALLDGYRELLTRPLPDGLLRTELLRGENGQWRIQTLWRDRAALDAVRARPEPPAAPALFREVGVEPTVTILHIEVGRLVP